MTIDELRRIRTFQTVGDAAVGRRSCIGHDPGTRSVRSRSSAAGPYPASLVAESPVRLLSIDRESVLAAMKLDPGLAMTFLRTLAHRVRELATRLEARMADPVGTRLARHLVARADSSGRADFDLGMTQASLAHDLGTVREVVARRLGELVASGVLARTGRSRFRVVDRGRLDALIGDEPPGGLPARVRLP
jgi:CRP-like cAMP-binding protein